MNPIYNLYICIIFIHFIFFHFLFIVYVLIAVQCFLITKQNKYICIHILYINYCCFRIKQNR